MLVENIPLSKIGSNSQLRNDVKYNSFTTLHDWKAFPNFNEHIKISDILIRLPVKKIKKGDLERKVIVINIPDQTPNSGNLNIDSDSFVDSIGSDKTILTNSDLIFSKLGTSKGNIYLNEIVGEEVLGSSEFIPFKFKNSKHKKVYLYLFLTPELREIYSYLESGKTPSHRRVNPEEFLKIKIPRLNEKTLDILSEKIEEYETEMKEYKTLLTPMRDIINKVFGDYFGYEPDLYYKYGKGMTYGTKFGHDKQLRVTNIKVHSISKSSNLRMSVRINNNISYFISGIIDRMDTEIIRNLVESPVSRGSTPTYSSQGEIPVIKTGHLTNYEVIKSNEFVSRNFYDKRKKGRINKGDILLASTGKGSLGKIDLFTDDETSFADSHLTIIRINPEKYNSQFLVYWLRSLLGVYQIESSYTGSTNQIELSDTDIEEYKVPKISLNEQSKIIEEISSNYIKQNGFKFKIKELRNDIENLIINNIIN